MRILTALAVALRGFLATLWRLLRQLLHEVAGALFVLFALLGCVSVWREWKRGSAAWLIGVVAAFTVMMAAFAFSSFRSARRLKANEK